MDDDDEEWDLAVIEELEKKAQEANAARRATQPSSSAPPFLAPHFYSAEGVKQTGMPSPFHLRNPISNAAEESPQKLHEELQEKDGAISLLRSRLKQTEQELYELRRRVSMQTAIQQTPQQLREVEHLSSQLLFKDQEIMQVKRACVEKEERLKSALHTAVLLQQEVETLKRKRETVENKPFQGSVMEGTRALLESKEHLTVCISEKDHASQDTCQLIGNEIQRSSKDLYDHWVTPWSSDKVVKVPPDIISRKGFKETSDMPITNGISSLSARKCSDYDGSPSKTDPGKAELLEFSNLHEGNETGPLKNGCGTSNDEFNLISSKRAQDHIATVKEPIRAVSQANEREHSTACPQSQPKNSEWTSKNDDGVTYMAEQLSRLWKIKDIKEAGCDLVAKMFAHCPLQLHALLKFDGSQSSSSEKFHEEEETNHSISLIKTPMRKENSGESALEDQAAVSLKFHEALASVSNGLSSTVALLRPLIEFCSYFDRGHLVQSSLCILSCILQHDPSCRETLLGRSRFCLMSEKGDFTNSYQKSNVNIRGLGWVIINEEKVMKKCITTTDQGTSSDALFFISERITCSLNQRSTSGKELHHSKHGHSKHQAKEVTEAQMDSVGDYEPCIFLRWVLDLAIASTAPGIRYEAIRLMCILLMHTEPLSERAKFTSLIFSEQLFSLLRKEEGVDVQLQTLKLVHLLLHCPEILRKVCQVEETIEDTNFPVITRGQKDCQETSPRLLDDKTGRFKFEKLKKVEQDVDKDKTELEVNKYGTDLLKGLATCVSFTGVSSQEYSLRKDALRVLAYIATSGDNRAEFLLQEIPIFDSSDAGRSTKERQLGGQTVVPDSVKEKSSNAVLDSVPADLRGPSKSPAAGPLLSSESKTIDTQGKKELQCSSQNIPCLLVSLINFELLVDDGDQTAAHATTSTQRSSIIREALTLLCRLASHPIHSSLVVEIISRDKRTLSASINVMNKLIRRGSQIDASGSAPDLSVSVPELVDLAKSLRRRIIAGSSL